jgi:hypothetical protein
MDTEKHFVFKDEEVATTATSNSQSPSPDENALHLEIQGEIYTSSITIKPWPLLIKHMCLLHRNPACARTPPYPHTYPGQLHHVVFCQYNVGKSRHWIFGDTIVWSRILG